MQSKNLSGKIIVILSLFIFMLSSCSAIEGVFEAGMWTGIIAVVGVIALIIFIIFRFFRRR